MNAYIDELARLRAANPVPVEPDRGLSPAAAATLELILQEPLEEAIGVRCGGRPSAGRLRRWIRVGSSRRLILALAAVVTAGGVAFAATDPLGWWSDNPTSAKYRSNPTVRVPTPTAREIACLRSNGILRCSLASEEVPAGVALVNGHPSTAQLYRRIDAIPPPVRGFTRHALLAYIARRRAAGAITAAQAAQLRADLAAVPDSFFSEYELGSRYGTYGVGGQTRDGLTLVPPRGIPAIVVCERAGRGLSCRDLNGDTDAPIGAGVYGAMTTRGWRYERVPPENWNLPPGFSFTPAEYRVLIDMLRFATVTRVSHVVRGKATPCRRLKSTPHQWAC